MYQININGIEKYITYPGVKNKRYIIDSFGNVYNIKTNKYLKHKITKKGYHAVRLSGEFRKNIFVFIHRLVAYEFVININNKPFVNHKDGNKSNNHISNLEWVTHEENMHHAFTTGLFDNKKKTKIGENGCNSKFSDILVNEIKYLVDSGITKAEVSRIMSRKYPELKLDPKHFQFYIYNLFSTSIKTRINKK